MTPAAVTRGIRAAAGPRPARDRERDWVGGGKGTARRRFEFDKMSSSVGEERRGHFAQEDGPGRPRITGVRAASGRQPGQRSPEGLRALEGPSPTASSAAAGGGDGEPGRTWGETAISATSGPTATPALTDGAGHAALAERASPLLHTSTLLAALTSGVCSGSPRPIS